MEKDPPNSFSQRYILILFWKIWKNFIGIFSNLLGIKERKTLIAKESLVKNDSFFVVYCQLLKNVAKKQRIKLA